MHPESERVMDSSIRALRHGLVQARRQSSLTLLDEVVKGVHDLAGSRYRCCLVDYNSFRPAFYVRVLGFENARIKAELEFPIEPEVRPIQWLPLSHLADYEEVVAGEDEIRRIYADVSPYLRRRTANLEEAEGWSRAPTVAGSNGNGSAPFNGRRRANGNKRGKGSRRESITTAVLWCVAGLLMAMSFAALLST